MEWKRSGAVLLFAVLIGSGCGLVPGKRNFRPEPEIASPQEAKTLADDARHSGFSYTGLAFYNGKLYASSSIGLLEYEGGKLSKLYRWGNGQFDVIEELASDKANGFLWASHSESRKFVRFDGANWSFVDLPAVAGGYSRGEALRGFDHFGTNAGFWLHNAAGAWRWSNGSWVLEVSAPTKNCSEAVADDENDIRCFAAGVPVGGKILTIMHRERIHENRALVDTSVPNPSDRVYFRSGSKWREVPGGPAVNFVTEKVVVTDDAAFIKSFYGELFRVTDTEITAIEPLGEVEAMTATTSGNLLVSFRNVGIHEYVDGWVKRFPPPYGPDEPEHFTHLAESDGKVAIAISAHRDKNFRALGETALWISEGGELKAAPFVGTK
jgi:hypothetical protein